MQCVDCCVLPIALFIAYYFFVALFKGTSSLRRGGEIEREEYYDDPPEEV